MLGVKNKNRGRATAEAATTPGQSVAAAPSACGLLACPTCGLHLETLALRCPRCRATIPLGCDGDCSRCATRG
jgi:hypothetical protein